MSIAIGSQPAKLYLGDVLLTGSSGWVSDESTLLNIVGDLDKIVLNGLSLGPLQTPFTMEVCKEIDENYSRSDGAIFYLRARNNFGFKIDATAGNEILIANGSGNSSTWNKTGKSFPAGARHTLSCVFGATSNDVYFDGELLGSYTPIASVDNPISVIYFNYDGTTQHTVTGTAYAYRLYNRALTAAEIKQNYTQDIAAFGGDV